MEYRQNARIVMTADKCRCAIMPVILHYVYEVVAVELEFDCSKTDKERSLH